jgi:hypothetical protein
MSDMSHRWCKRCKNPEYACECDEGEEQIEKLSPVGKRLRGIEPWEDQYWLTKPKGTGR